MPSVIQAGTASNTALTLTSDTSGELQIKTNNGSTTALTLTTGGNINIPTTGARITGDFSNATVANRVLFQTSTASSRTQIGVIPNGSGTEGRALLNLYNTTDPTNSGSTVLYVDTTISAILADRTGTGTYLPLTMYTGGSERLRIDTSGNVGIGTSSPGQKLHVAGAGSTYISVTSSNAATGSGLYTANATNAYYIGAGAASGGSSLEFRDSTNSATRMVIDSSGRVGIGTTSPTYTLEVATGTSGQQSLANFRTANSTAANNAGIQIFATPSATAGSRNVLVSWDADGADTSGGDYFYIQKLGNSGNVELAQYSNAAMIFSTNGGSERMRITSGGWFKAKANSNYVGESSSYHELTGATGDLLAIVANYNATTPSVMQFYLGGASPDNNTEYFLRCYDTTANRTFIYSDGDVWTSDAGTLTSDLKLKTDITDATPKLADVMKLKVRNFYWKEDYHPNKTDKKLIGFIAQEFEEVFPGLVSEHNHKGGQPIYEKRPVVDDEGNQLLDEEGNPKTEQVKVGETEKEYAKGIKEGKLIPILVKAMQEQQAMIEELKQEVAKLKGV